MWRTLRTEATKPVQCPRLLEIGGIMVRNEDGMVINGINEENHENDEEDCV